MRIVAALGGNALLQRGQPLTAQQQLENIEIAVSSLTGLIRAGHQLIITHGNGPQVGLLAEQDAAMQGETHFPLHVIGAESEGMIGHLIEMGLRNELGHNCKLGTLLTQVLVDADDAAFSNPTKFVGPGYERGEAEQMAAQHSWHIAADGERWRRVVASPKPVQVLNSPVMAMLLDEGAHLICAGGGGIPVAKDVDGKLQGVEAVIDKDMASACVAHQLNADALLLLTDVDAVYRNFDSDNAAPLSQLNIQQARRFEAPAGSMGPKIEAAVLAAEQGRLAVIGQLADAVAMLRGDAGTRIGDN